MQLIIQSQFQELNSTIVSCVENFNTSGSLFVDGKRNKIKLFKIDGTTLSIKSFKVPNRINQVVYKFFRKSKAQRSFEFANLLLEKGIKTPQPFAYAEDFTFFGLESSFYVCEHLQVDLTFRELVEIVDYPDYDNILSQFMQFCFLLHEKGVEFLDHSPGNTLIKKVSDTTYEFYLVDLNRMNFLTEMSFEKRMKNLSHLTPRKDMIAQMSHEYSKLYTSETENKIFQKMWGYTYDFQKKYHQKIRLKKLLKFWK